MAGTTTKSRAVRTVGQRATNEEIATKEHDALLRWLIDNLDAVAEDLYGKGPEWIEEQAGQARERSAQRWTRYAEQLEERGKQGATMPAGRFGLEQKPVSDEARALFKKKAQELGAWAGSMPFDRPDDSLAEASVVSYEAMKPVERLDDKPTTTKRSRAGFVDVAAIVREPQTLILQEDKEADSRDSFVGGMYDTEEEVRKRAEKLQKDKVGWWMRSTGLDVWFRVRTQEFTLGEILQELKALRQLENKKQVVVLCVRQIEDDLREHIEHEGFGVVAAADYEEN